MYSVVLGGAAMILFGPAFLYLIHKQQKKSKEKGHM